MKKTLLIIAMLFVSAAGFSQIDFGIKAGFNYNKTGDLKDQAENAILDGGSGKAGFHAGVWLRGNVPIIGLYLRPEFMYTQISSEYEYQGNKGNFDLQKLDVPILIGKKFLGFAHAFIGPSFQFVVDSDFDAEDIQDIDTDSFTLGMQMGLGVEFGSLGLDVRWERGLSDSEAKIVSNNSDNLKIDSRPNQVIFGLSYKF
ncbi:Outer membrane protein beta-barrel domain-containing protein [Sinomicrobium oceani]|uniref:Outer membrane protein beta-barrel domain-containing protein n=1 Tax=Sinomicrobium oceani TaxID=1150368 RepID=A0A1K1LU26_9FLAO|nr:outer membrane beta-barrel protein [Sinomicrobium oceani]SFW14344.1 Outer membrane protein beta-barrel domain-containing protein [Sinomicrobium oceani]